MPIKTALIKSWSYSRYALWVECPAKFKYKHIDKIPEERGPAMIRGEEIHKLAEDYTIGKLKKMPQELKLFKNEFELLKKSKPFVEQSWAFRQDWSETVWNDWNGCWLRIKADAGSVDGDVLHVIDHKTGKKYDNYGDQMNLSALGGMLKFPHIKTVQTYLWFLDIGDVVEEEYQAKNMKVMMTDWEKKVKPMFNDTRFAPKPSYKCSRCPFSKAKGGPCKY